MGNQLTVIHNHGTINVKARNIDLTTRTHNVNTSGNMTP